MPVWLKHSVSGFDEGIEKLVTHRRGAPQKVDAVVAKIVSDVIERGDEALIEYTKRFDRFATSASSLRVSPAEIAKAKESVSPGTMTALKQAAQRIELFHQRHMPRDDHYVDPQGVTLGARWTPVDAAGLYVPGGLAAYPSSVLMNAIPARIAGVARIVAVTPTPGGKLNQLVLAAAELAGVHEVYRVGGAQAVAALAYGTATIKSVDKIVGPGNAYVAEAKRQVFGHVGIDSIAGPSEVLIIADSDNNPAWLAADLLAQAEHDEEAQSILITDSQELANDVATEIERQLAVLPREAIARVSWERHGVVIVLRNLNESFSISDRIAPEHLQICTKDPEGIAKQIRHAGAIFLGANTPEAIGDYVGGPNHVLPTSRAARFSSGLSALDFMKRTTILGCSTQSLKELGPSAATLADAEGLQAHAQSIRIRIPK